MLQGSEGGGWGYTYLNIFLKCSVSAHKIFTGKIGHLFVIKSKKKKNTNSLFFYAQFSLKL